jgi:uridine phosphorylase
MNWREHMRENAVNWLTRGDSGVVLDANFLMLFGNPYLFRREVLEAVLTDVTPAGVFYRAKYNGVGVSLCHPLFGAPATAMYAEVIARLGVRNVVACGYVGGIGQRLEIGGYVIPSTATGLDGCTRAYFPHRLTFPGCPQLQERLGRLAGERGEKHETGALVSIDALMLEDDEMIRQFDEQGYCCVDLETACLYAVGGKCGLSVSAVHIVSDSPSRKLIDPEQYHEAAFPGQVRIALEALTAAPARAAADGVARGAGVW